MRTKEHPLLEVGETVYGSTGSDLQNSVVDFPLLNTSEFKSKQVKFDSK